MSRHQIVLPLSDAPIQKQVSPPRLITAVWHCYPLKCSIRPQYQELQKVSHSNSYYWKHKYDNWIQSEGGSCPQVVFPGVACPSTGAGGSWHWPWQNYLGHLSIRLRFPLRCFGRKEIKRNSVVHNQMCCLVSPFQFHDTRICIAVTRENLSFPF